MRVILERLRVLWLGILALIIAFILLILAMMAQRDIGQKLGELRQLLGNDLVIIHFQKPISRTHLNELSLRLNDYQLAAVSPMYKSENGVQLRAISKGIARVDRHWLKEGRWPDEGDSQGSIDVSVYSGQQGIELGGWQKIGTRQYKIIGLIDQKVAGFIFGEVGRELNLLTYSAINPTRRQISTLLLRPNLNRGVNQLDEEGLYQFIDEKNLPNITILSANDLAKKSNELHLQLTQGLWLMGAICGVLAFSTVLMMLLRDVKDRTQEIGLRRALGAKPTDIARMIMSEVTLMMLFTFGVAISLVSILRLVSENEWLNRPIIGIETVYMVIVIMVLSLILAYLPAARASRISPMQALRG